MSTIADFSELVARSEEYYGADDLYLEMPRFVGMAETKLNRRLRVSDMQSADVVAVTDGVGTLPNDFLELRDARYSTYPALRAWPYSSLLTRYTSSGIPSGYAVVGSTLYARPMFTGDLDIVYWAKIPSLTLSNDTNWLLTRAPEVYLYAICVEIAIWLKDAQKGQAFSQMLDGAVGALKSEDEGRLYSNGRVIMGGVTP